MFRLTKKLNELKPEVRKLSKKQVDDISKRTKAAHKILCELRNINLTNPSSADMEEETRAYDKWSLLSFIEEKVLSQKAK